MPIQSVIHAFFMMLDQDKADLHLEKLLKKVVVTCHFTDSIFKMLFKNGISAEVTSDGMSSFRLKLSDTSFYDSGDNEFKLLSDDRIRYYLKSLANYKY